MTKDPNEAGPPDPKEPPQKECPECGGTGWDRETDGECLEGAAVAVCTTCGGTGLVDVEEDEPEPMFDTVEERDGER
jgi:DnaJ-class molecular chaperone